MQIPSQPNRQVMPSGNAGSIEARNLGNKAGSGLNAMGTALAQGGNTLAHAFLYAQHQRDQINAHLDSLNQRTGAYDIALNGQDGMGQDFQDFAEQLKQQQGTNPQTWKLTVKGQDGNPVTGSPDDIARMAIDQRMLQGLQAADAYGPEAKMHVQASLSQAAFNNLSQFRNLHIQMKHDTSLASWQDAAQRFEQKAADPTNPLHGNAKMDLAYHVDSGVRAGLFSPTEGAKLKQGYQASVNKKYGIQYALRYPQEFLNLVNDRGGTAVPGPDGTIQTSIGGPKKLPDDFNAEELPHLTSIALGAMAHYQNESDAQQKRLDQQTARIHEQNYRDKMSMVLSGNSVAGDLPADLQDNQLSVEQANTLRTVEHTLKVQATEDPTLKKNSAVSLFGYTKQITQAKFTDGNLSDIEDQVTDSLKAGTMLPTDAQTALTQLRDAQSYQQSEAKQEQNQRVQAAHKNLMGALTTTGPLDKYDALSEEAKGNADEYFWNAMGKNPNQDPWKLKADIEKIWNPVLADRKKIIGDQTQAMFDEAKLQTMVQAGALTKAGAKAIRDRQENEKGRKIVTDFLSTYKPPEPSFLEKMGQSMKNLGQVGSSFFQDPEETPQ